MSMSYAFLGIYHVSILVTTPDGIRELDYIHLDHLIGIKNKSTGLNKIKTIYNEYNETN
jgi:hypothetical protein